MFAMLQNRTEIVGPDPKIMVLSKLNKLYL